MHDAVLVGKVKGFADLGEQLVGEGGRQFPPRDELVDIAAVDVFHRQITITGGHIEVEDGGDIGMAEAGHGPGFGAEAADGFAVLGRVRREDFDGDGTVQGALGAGIDCPHAAGCDQVADFVLGQHGTELLRAGRDEGFGRHRGG